jgi:MFS family permease
MFVSISVISSIDALVAYLPLYGESVGLPIEFVTTLLALRAGASLVSRIFMGPAIAHLGRSTLLVVSMTAAAIALVAVTLTAAPAALIVLLIAVGLGLGLGQPMTMAWVANRSPRAERGTALGVRLTGHRAALFVVPSLLGTVAGATGVAAIFWVLAAFLGSGAGVALRSPFDEPVEPQSAPVPG